MGKTELKNRVSRIYSSTLEYTEGDNTEGEKKSSASIYANIGDLIQAIRESKHDEFECTDNSCMLSFDFSPVSDKNLIFRIDKAKCLMKFIQSDHWNYMHSNPLIRSSSSYPEIKNYLIQTIICEAGKKIAIKNTKTEPIKIKNTEIKNMHLSKEDFSNTITSLEL